MCAEAVQARPGVEESVLLLDLAAKMMQAKDLRELVEPFLEGIATLSGAPATVLFLNKNPLAGETFFQVGLAPEAAPTVTGLCEECLGAMPDLSRAAPRDPDRAALW